jgi:glutathione S-transferase
MCLQTTSGCCWPLLACSQRSTHETRTTLPHRRIVAASLAASLRRIAAPIARRIAATTAPGSLTHAGVFFANQYLVVGVMQARKKYGIKYPNLYAPPGHKNEEAFNCAQRAHQNTVESMPLFLVELVLVGLFYPLFAASCGGLWSVGRILYGYGYKTKGPDGRLIGSLISHLGDLPLQIAVFKLCYVAFTTW